MQHNAPEQPFATPRGATVQQLRAMFSQAAVGIAITAPDGHFLEANDRACQIFGYVFDELRGKTYLDLTHPEDAPRTREHMLRLQTGQAESYVVEKRYVRKDGSDIWCSTTVIVLRDLEGRPEQFFGIVQDIDDRKVAEELRSRLAAVVESSDDAIITKTLDGIITTWNPAAVLMFGYTANEVIGRPITVVIPDEYLGEEPQILQRLRRGDRIHHYETIRRRKDGTLINVSLSVSPVKDAAGRIVGASKIARDITRRKRDEAALRENSHVLELLAASGRSISSGLDLNTILQRVTDLGTQMSGAEFGAFFYNVMEAGSEAFRLFTLSGAPRSAFEQLGLPRNTPVFRDTFSGSGIVRSDDICNDARYGQIGPHFGMPKGHLPVRSYLAVPVVRGSGEVIGGLFFGHSRPGVFTELAEKVVAGIAGQASMAIENARLYEEAHREIASREMAETKLREADRRKDEFLATLAHELRNPLAPIRNAAMLAGSAVATEEQKRSSQAVIERQVRHMSTLLDDLLDNSRITRGAFDLRLARTTLGEIVDAATETARPAIEARRHDLRVEISERGAPLQGDALRLAQIIGNLLLNAAKYTDDGGTITLRAVAHADTIEISVRDTGIGIAADALPHLFEMFAQLKSARSRASEGLGIGLALSRGLAQLHGGTLEGFSEGEGRGSEFTLRIPRRLETLAPAPTQPAMPTRAAGARSVLIADDNEDAALTLAMLLEVSGHQVVVAHDGEEALARFEESKPEVALLDIGMPRLDGYEVARRLRSRAGNSLQLIALTGWGQTDDKARALAAGFDMHFTKPVDPERILELLSTGR